MPNLVIRFFSVVGIGRVVVVSRVLRFGIIWGVAVGVCGSGFLFVVGMTW